MQEDMNLSINGQSQVPPGFRFHPTEEELLHYYLRKKVAYEKIDLDVIREVDLNKLEPWDIQEKCKIGSTPQNDWYFFSHKDKKYPTGTRTNRATAAGFWKATGRDKIIYSSFRRIGLRKTLVFYKGRAPHGQKSDWIMHEYRLDDSTLDTTGSNPINAEAVPEEGWVVCRVFRKKNYQKTLDSPKGSSSSMDSKTSSILGSAGNEGVLDQILNYMGRTCKMENEPFSNLNISNNNNNNNNNSNNNLRFLSSTNTSISEGLIHERFMHLPRLDSPSYDQDRGFKSCYQSYEDMLTDNEPSSTNQAANNGSFDMMISTTPAAAHHHHHHHHDAKSAGGQLSDWVTLDRLVASQLNGQVVDSSSKQLSCFSTDPNASYNIGLSLDDDEDVLQSHRSSNNIQANSQVFSNDNDLWSFTKSSSSPSSSDPLCHLSV